MKRCPILVEIREMQMKIITRLTLQPSDSQKLDSWIISRGGAGIVRPPCGECKGAISEAPCGCSW